MQNGICNSAICRNKLLASGLHVILYNTQNIPLFEAKLLSSVFHDFFIQILNFILIFEYKNIFFYLRFLCLANPVVSPGEIAIFYYNNSVLVR